MQAEYLVLQRTIEILGNHGQKQGAGGTENSAL
jgi:hypothetical protein